MRRGLCPGLVCACGAAVLGFHTRAAAADGGWPSPEGGGWPTLDGGPESGSSDAGAVDVVQPPCAYGDAGYGDGGTQPNTMSPETILAYYCGDAEMQCVTAPLAFDKTIDLKDSWPSWAQGFDTGWIPQSFPELQVRFILEIPAETQVKLSGKLRTTWPDALTLVTPGDRTSGFIKFDYGLVLHAWGKIDVSVLGYHIKWQGDIPYLPQVDFHLLGMKQFDSWAFEPNPVSLSAFTPQVKLFEVNVLGLAGIPKEIASGGVSLNIKGELKTTYVTDKMLITPSVAPITTESGATLDNYVGGAFVEYDVHPEGHATYDGVIHLVPAFYIDIINGAAHFEIPFYDYPISLSSIIGQTLTQDFVFDKVKVHVPLPDIPRLQQTTYDFGEVPVGSGEKIKIPVPNWGEGKARAYGEVEASMKSIFKVMTQTIYIDPCATEDITVRFNPKKAGPFQTTLTLYSNDPDVPMQQITLKGKAVGEDLTDPDGGQGPGPGAGGDGGGGLGSVPGSGDDGGCGCRMRRSDAGSWGALAALGLVALAASRRRRAWRKCD